MLSENIKVSEVSDILRKQLEGIDTRVQLDEIGTVLQVSDGVARIYGLRNAEANELLEFDNGIKAIVMNLEEDNVGAVLLGPTDKIKEGFVVKRTKRIASIMVGEGMLGRVIDPLGEPLDGKGLIGGIYDRCYRRTFLADSYVDTVYGVACLVVGTLVDDGIDGNCGLTRLTVADNQLTLPAADRNHGIDSLQTGLQRLRRVFPRYRPSCVGCL